MKYSGILAAVFALIALGSSLNAAALLNVSYDSTRELYREYNAFFEKQLKAKSGAGITIRQSHGGSGKQARAVIYGLKADVVTLALGYDIDQISSQAKLLPKNWQHQFPHNSSPYTSTVVFVVRKGNPKGVKDWNDLVKAGIQVITPNPKTSGGARWNFLAAWSYGLGSTNSEKAAIVFVTKLIKNVPVLDSGARGATITFVERGLGDVLVAWENEALEITRDKAPGEYEIVYPSISILAEPAVAVVEANVQKRGNLAVAKAYLQTLYSPEAQEIVAKNYYRPSDAKVLAKYRKQFPVLKLADIDKNFGGWAAAQKKFFDDNGVFDQVYGVK